MPPKKDATGADSTELITGFSEKDCKLLAAAFLSSTASDKYDYDLMATLTKNTAGSLKKMWPPVKRKAMEAHISFAAFLGQSSITTNGENKPAPALKASNNKKRKVAAEDPNDNADEDKEELEPDSAGKRSGSSKPATKKKASTAKGKGGSRKKAKKELSAERVSEDENEIEAEAETETKIKSDKNSDDGECSLGEDVEEV